MITVLGATGTIGREVTSLLTGAGVPVRCVSRSLSAPLPERAEHLALDLREPDGARRALDGASTVLDLTNNPVRPGPLHRDGTRRLLDAARRQGIDHFVGISIVGCEKVGLGYYRAKAAQAELVRSGPVPWTLLEATQFHELIDSAFAGAARLGITPSGAIPLQPIAAREVGDELVEIVKSGPAGNRRVAGPEVNDLRELAAIWKSATGKRSLSLPFPAFGRSLRALREGALCDPKAARPGPTFAGWLEGKYPRGA
jgi:uncharacterized protein YbjT (DUF2867 family)